MFCTFGHVCPEFHLECLKWIIVNQGVKKPTCGVLFFFYVLSFVVISTGF